MDQERLSSRSDMPPQANQGGADGKAVEIPKLFLLRKQARRTCGHAAPRQMERTRQSGAAHNSSEHQWTAQKTLLYWQSRLVWRETTKLT